MGYPAPDTNLEFIPLRYLFVLSALRDCVAPLTGSLTRICSGLLPRWIAFTTAEEPHLQNSRQNIKSEKHITDHGLVVYHATGFLIEAYITGIIAT